MPAKQSSGAGRGIALILILIELFGAFFIGTLLMKNFGSESISASNLYVFAAGLAGVFVYVILHVIPGIRWLMMAVMICVWAFAAYQIGLLLIGIDQDSFQFVTHKGPYIAAAIAGLFRGIMYR